MSVRLPTGRRIGVQFGLAAALGIIGLLVFSPLGLGGLGGGAAFGLGLFLGALLGVLPWAVARDRRAPARTGGGAPRGKGERKTVYVGNLAFKASRDELRELFEPYGEVHSVRIMTDRATRKPRGFGFVEMDPAGADAAIDALNGQEFLGRTLKVNIGKERPEKEPRKEP
ncbi:MAG TPA: RNA-binding protein [Gammaproteobacteria bacterium]|nr:RNA-binding protein [Gammaproteobacteria bacterium]